MSRQDHVLVAGLLSKIQICFNILVSVVKILNT